jgi:CDP-diacylglycerol--glycerol-3-phosphate 3-phosphatidyltransferase
MSRPGDPPCGHRGCARPERERLLTGATVLTFVRTAAAVTLCLLGARQESLALLLAGLAAYWLGDVADGTLARARDEETRAGATLDILCDRACAACFYVGFAWLDPTMVVPVGVYLAQFCVVDAFLSLAFLAWPLVSPDYFHLVDRRIWRWNWSKPAKAVNSAAFALLLVLTREPVVATVIAAALLVTKAVSLSWLVRLPPPVPAGCVARAARVDVAL